MEKQEAFVSCIKKYAVFSGRAAGSEYWWFVLCEILIVVGVSMLSEKLGSLAALVLLMPVIAAEVRRLHDIGRPLDLLRVHREKIEACILEQAGIVFDAEASPSSLHLAA